MRCQRAAGELASKSRATMMLTLILSQRGQSESIPSFIRSKCGLSLAFAARTVDDAIAGLGPGIRDYPTLSPGEFLRPPGDDRSVHREPVDRAGPVHPPPAATAHLRRCECPSSCDRPSHAVTRRCYCSSLRVPDDVRELLGRLTGVHDPGVPTLQRVEVPGLARMPLHGAWAYVCDRSRSDSRVRSPGVAPPVTGCQDCRGAHRVFTNGWRISAA